MPSGPLQGDLLPQHPGFIECSDRAVPLAFRTEERATAAVQAAARDRGFDVNPEWYHGRLSHYRCFRRDQGCAFQISVIHVRRKLELHVVHDWHNHMRADSNALLAHKDRVFPKQAWKTVADVIQREGGFEFEKVEPIPSPEDPGRAVKRARSTIACCQRPSGCPFAVELVVIDGGRFYVRSVCNAHNHETVETLLVPPLAVFPEAGPSTTRPVTTAGAAPGWNADGPIGSPQASVVPPPRPPPLDWTAPALAGPSSHASAPMISMCPCDPQKAMEIVPLAPVLWMADLDMDSAQAHLRLLAHQRGFSLVTHRSRTAATFSCVEHYRGCPFEVSGAKGSTAFWRLRMINDSHNHGRLSPTGQEEGPPKLTAGRLLLPPPVVAAISILLPTDPGGIRPLAPHLRAAYPTEVAAQAHIQQLTWGSGFQVVGAGQLVNLPSSYRCTREGLGCPFHIELWYDGNTIIANVSHDGHNHWRRDFSPAYEPVGTIITPALSGPAAADVAFMDLFNRVFLNPLLRLDTAVKTLAKLAEGRGFSTLQWNMPASLQGSRGHVAGIYCTRLGRGCPFAVAATCEVSPDGWRLALQNSHHNHPLLPYRGASPQQLASNGIILPTIAAPPAPSIFETSSSSTTSPFIPTSPTFPSGLAASPPGTRAPPLPPLAPTPSIATTTPASPPAPSIPAVPLAFVGSATAAAPPAAPAPSPAAAPPSPVAPSAAAAASAAPALSGAAAPPIAASLSAAAPPPGDSSPTSTAPIAPIAPNPTTPPTPIPPIGAALNLSQPTLDAAHTELERLSRARGFEVHLTRLSSTDPVWKLQCHRHLSGCRFLVLAWRIGASWCLKIEVEAHNHARTERDGLPGVQNERLWASLPDLQPLAWGGPGYESASSPESDSSQESNSSPESGSSLESGSSPESGSSLESGSSPESGSSLESGSSPESPSRAPKRRRKRTGVADLDECLNDMPRREYDDLMSSVKVLATAWGRAIENTYGPGSRVDSANTTNAPHAGPSRTAGSGVGAQPARSPPQPVTAQPARTPHAGPAAPSGVQGAPSGTSVRCSSSATPTRAGHTAASRAPPVTPATRARVSEPSGRSRHVPAPRVKAELGSSRCALPESPAAGPAAPPARQPILPTIAIRDATRMVSDDADWLHHTWAEPDGSGLFLSSAHARVLALKYPSVLTITAHPITPTGMPYIQVCARHCFEDLPDGNSFTAAVAFVPSLDRAWYTRALRALIEHVLFDASRTKVVVTILDDALGEAVAEVFPDAFHHLCQTSIIQKIRDSSEYPQAYHVTKFVDEWKALVADCPSASALSDRLAQVVGSREPNTLDRDYDRICAAAAKLAPLYPKFVRCFIDGHPHKGVYSALQGSANRMFRAFARCYTGFYSITTFLDLYFKGEFAAFDAAAQGNQAPRVQSYPRGDPLFSRLAHSAIRLIEKEQRAADTYTKRVTELRAQPGWGEESPRGDALRWLMPKLDATTFAEVYGLPDRRVLANAALKKRKLSAHDVDPHWISPCATEIQHLLRTLRAQDADIARAGRSGAGAGGRKVPPLILTPWARFWEKSAYAAALGFTPTTPTRCDKCPRVHLEPFCTIRRRTTLRAIGPNKPHCACLWQRNQVAVCQNRSFKCLSCGRNDRAIKTYIRDRERERLRGARRRAEAGERAEENLLCPTEPGAAFRIIEPPVSAKRERSPSPVRTTATTTRVAGSSTPHAPHTPAHQGTPRRPSDPPTGCRCSWSRASDHAEWVRTIQCDVCARGDEAEAEVEAQQQVGSAPPAADAPDTPAGVTAVPEPAVAGPATPRPSADDAEVGTSGPSDAPSSPLSDAPPAASPSASSPLSAAPSVPSPTHSAVHAPSANDPARSPLADGSVRSATPNAPAEADIAKAQAEAESPMDPADAVAGGVADPAPELPAQPEHPTAPSASHEPVASMYDDTAFNDIAHDTTYDTAYDDTLASLPLAVDACGFAIDTEGPARCSTCGWVGEHSPRCTAGAAGTVDGAGAPGPEAAAGVPAEPSVGESVEDSGLPMPQGSEQEPALPAAPVAAAPAQGDEGALAVADASPTSPMDAALGEPAEIVRAANTTATVSFASELLGDTAKRYDDVLPHDEAAAHSLQEHLATTPEHREEEELSQASLEIQTQPHSPLPHEVEGQPETEPDEHEHEHRQVPEEDEDEPRTEGEGLERSEIAENPALDEYPRHGEPLGADEHPEADEDEDHFEPQLPVDSEHPGAEHPELDPEELHKDVSSEAQKDAQPEHLDGDEDFDHALLEEDDRDLPPHEPPNPPSTAEPPVREDEDFNHALVEDEGEPELELLGPGEQAEVEDKHREMRGLEPALLSRNPETISRTGSAAAVAPDATEGSRGTTPVEPTPSPQQQAHLSPTEPYPAVDVGSPPGLSAALAQEIAAERRIAARAQEQAAKCASARPQPSQELPQAPSPVVEGHVPAPEEARETPPIEENATEIDLEPASSEETPPHRVSPEPPQPPDAPEVPEEPQAPEVLYPSDAPVTAEHMETLETTDEAEQPQPPSETQAVLAVADPAQRVSEEALHPPEAQEVSDDTRPPAPPMEAPKPAFPNFAAKCYTCGRAPHSPGCGRAAPRIDVGWSWGLRSRSPPKAPAVGDGSNGPELARETVPPPTPSIRSVLGLRPRAASDEGGTPTKRHREE